MRVTALVIGMFGGFWGVYLSQLLVGGTAVIGAFGAAFGAQRAGEPLLWGVAALASFTLGIIGGSLSIQRPGVAALLMSLAAVSGTVSIVQIGPAAMNMAATVGGPTARPFATLAPSFYSTPAPSFSSFGALAQDNNWGAIGSIFGGAVLLVLASLLAASSIEVEVSVERGEPTRTGRRRFSPAEPHRSEVPATPVAVTNPSQVAAYSALTKASRAALVGNSARPLLAAPEALSATVAMIEPQRSFEVLGQVSSYVYVALETGMHGWIAKKDIRGA